MTSREAYLPAYYRSRIYIDLSDASKYSENFDRLLRWAHDQPLYQKPDIGSKPSFLTEGISPALATSSRFKRAIDSVRNNRDYAQPAVAEYLQCLAGEIEKLRIEPSASPFDESVIQSIEAFIPYRNEAIEMFLTLATYRDAPETRTGLHRFFEQLIPYMNRPQGVSSWRERDFDNFRFIIHELFLYALACLIRHERFETASYLMSNDYYVPGQSDYGRDVMVRFSLFHKPADSLAERNVRLDLRRLSLRADILFERCKGVGIEFRHLMQADFVLFLRSRLDGGSFHRWWPETLLYSRNQSGAFEVFARSRSASYFSQSKSLLGVGGKEELQLLLQSLATEGSIPSWQYESFSPAHLVGFDQIATKP